jgi:hypothetical protein
MSVNRAFYALTVCVAHALWTPNPFTEGLVIRGPPDALLFCAGVAIVVRKVLFVGYIDDCPEAVAHLFTAITD